MNLIILILTFLFPLCCKKNEEINQWEILVLVKDGYRTPIQVSVSSLADESSMAKFQSPVQESSYRIKPQGIWSSCWYKLGGQNTDEHHQQQEQQQDASIQLKLGPKGGSLEMKGLPKTILKAWVFAIIMLSLIALTLVYDNRRKEIPITAEEVVHFC
uniref:Uncharacterized protein n=1 Tax=Nelumbo nucifera TaxID=4432 RepID=A0A822XU84_NELNU|nr:TPA_asm: hypothetical protein HUJ06_024194 [Nelumbo nucifera]